MTFFLIGYGLFSGAALVWALLLGLRAYENRRYFLSRLRHPILPAHFPQVELIVPCKGIDLGFDAMVEGVLTQDYPNYQITFVVEDQDDPAHGLLAGRLPRLANGRARLLVAGTANDCGQKVHNLLAATAQLSTGAEILAFMDSDIHPGSNWLARLVSNLEQPKFAAVTGYRWFVPREEGLASTALAALNAPIAGMLGNHGMNVVWGGAWAIRRSVFEDLRLREHWRNTLSDDLVVYQVLREARLRTAFEPACLVPSPASFTWGGLFEFARRQYLITRVYAPVLWCYGVLGGLIHLAALWTGLALFVILSMGGTWVPWLLLPSLAYYGLASARAWMRQSCLGGKFGGHVPALRRAARFDIWLHPLLNLANLFLLLSAAMGRTITWRSIRYILVSPRQTIIKDRPGKIPQLRKTAA